MTSSTKWMVAVFFIVAAFAAGLAVVHFSLVRATPGLAPLADHNFGTPPHAPFATSTPQPTPTPQPGGTNLLLNPGGGNVGIGTFSPAEQLEITGNFRLAPSTTSSGIIMVDEDWFIHNFGPSNFFAGVDAGNLTMTGNDNTGVGTFALNSITAGINNTATGSNALRFNTTGSKNTATGLDALLANTTGFQNTATGTSALASNTGGSQNTATGINALFNNTTGASNTATGREALGVNNGNSNTATGVLALRNNTTGFNNTATGNFALLSNDIGNNNTAVGLGADVSQGNLTNASAIGSNAVVDASNKIRLGDGNVTVIEGQVAFTAVSDANLKENFRLVDGHETLEKIRELTLASWNFKGHDPQQFRHYGPTAQDFFAAFGHDGFGTIGTDTTINSGDMAGIMMIAIQELAKQNAALQQRIDDLEARLAATGE